MLTGKNLLNELVDELNELKLSHMAAKLDSLYNAPGFLEMGHMTLLAELIGDEYQKRLSKTLTVYYGENVPLFRRNGYRKSGSMIP